MGLRDPHLTGRYRPGGSAFWSLDCWRCTDTSEFLIRRCELILPGCGGSSALARGATLATYWFHEPQAISNHPVGLGFLHLEGRYRTGRYLFSSPGCWSCKGMAGFLIRERKFFLPGCGTHAMVEHHFVSEAPHLRSSVPHTKTDFRGKLKCYLTNNPMA